MLKDNERINIINEDLQLIENKDSLTFGTDAYFLSAFLPRHAKHIGVELGVGSGVISLLALTKKKCAHVYGFEVQEDISDIAKRNAELNGLDTKFTVINKDLRNVTPIDTNGEVDFVFSNPPYMKVDSGKRNGHDEKFIARHEVCGDIGDFCAAAKRLLKHGGYFYCVWRPDRLTDLICSMRENALEPKEMCFVHANTKSAPSVVLVKAKKGAAAGVSVIEPLFLNLDNDAKTLTERAKKIYEECNF